MMRPRGHAEIKALAKEMGVAIPDLLVLARQNDPFVCGGPSDVLRAEWFADLWERFGYSSGVHLRRVHYQILSAGLACPDGTPYENTDACWSLLCAAGADAREVDLVAPDAFVDRKNAPVVLNAGEPRLEGFGPRWQIEVPSTWELPEIETEIAWDLNLKAGFVSVDGYDYDQADQPVLVECWVEKSTMNDVLEPLCRDLGVNLVVSSGFQSITNAVNLLQRAAEHNKPARVFYISDFDPAGDHMPVAVARQVEFWHGRYGKGVDLKINPLVLTHAQVLDYDLPRTPVKIMDRRRRGFEERRGEGAVELDALEALHPGVLDEVVRQAITPYRDEDLPRRLSQTGYDAWLVAVDAWREQTEEEQDRLSRIQDGIKEVTESFRDRLAALAGELAGDLDPHREELRAISASLRDKRTEVEIELPERPGGEIGEVDEAGWLFDAGRDYFDQLAAYRAHKAG